MQLYTTYAPNLYWLMNLLGTIVFHVETSRANPTIFPSSARHEKLVEVPSHDLFYKRKAEKSIPEMASSLLIQAIGKKMNTGMQHPVPRKIRPRFVEGIGENTRRKRRSLRSSGSGEGPHPLHRPGEVKDIDHRHDHGVDLHKHFENDIPKVADGSTQQENANLRVSHPIVDNSTITEGNDVKAHDQDVDFTEKLVALTEADFSGDQKSNKRPSMKSNKKTESANLHPNTDSSTETGSTSMSANLTSNIGRVVSRLPIDSPFASEDDKERHETKRDKTPSSESFYRDELLSVKIAGDEHEATVIWTYPDLQEGSGSGDGAPYYTGFKVTYKVAKGEGDEDEEYDSSKLGTKVRSFLLHSLHTDEEYIICVHVLVNTTTMQRACANWSSPSLKVIVGILAGTIFLIPCIIVLIWILHKDRKMRRKPSYPRYREGSDAKTPSEIEVRPSLEEKSLLDHTHHNHTDHQLSLPHKNGGINMTMSLNSKFFETNRIQSPRSIFGSNPI